MRDSTPLETDILNNAAIYFDFNEPVITNTTQHRVGINFVTVGAWSPVRPSFGVTIAPHPLQTAVGCICRAPPTTGITSCGCTT